VRTLQKKQSSNKCLVSNARVPKLIKKGFLAELATEQEYLVLKVSSKSALL
jgi:hypothetical protein